MCVGYRLNSLKVSRFSSLAASTGTTYRELQYQGKRNFANYCYFGIGRLATCDVVKTP